MDECGTNSSKSRSCVQNGRLACSSVLDWPGCSTSHPQEHGSRGFVARYGGRMAWMLLHVGVVLVVLFTDTSIHRGMKLFGTKYPETHVEVLFFGVVLANMLVFCWLCASNPGYVTPDSAPALAQPARALASSEACAATSSSDLDTMGLLPRSGGFSDQMFNEDSARAALLAERKLTPSPCPISETDDNWNVGSEHGIELLDNPSRMGSRQAHFRPDLCVAHEWFEGSAPGRVCRACGSWQPLRSRHCHDCCRCVEKFDHHCHWLGKCIGHGNHHVFWIFLLTETIVIMWVLAIILQEMSSTNSEERFLHKPAWKICVWAFVLLPLLLGLLTSGGLLLFHTYLLCTNQTTFEYAARWKVDYLKDIPSTRNPFNKGCINNLADACCFKLGHQYTLPSREVNLSASTSVSAIHPSGI